LEVSIYGATQKEKVMASAKEKKSAISFGVLTKQSKKVVKASKKTCSLTDLLIQV